MSAPSDLDAVLARFREALAGASDDKALYELQVRFLGKKGEVTGLSRSLGTLPPGDRKAFGERLNALKRQVELDLEGRARAIAEARRAAELAEVDDLTFVRPRPSLGTLHPVTRTRRELERVFSGLGFDVLDGPHVEVEKYNFDDLNIGPDHPARDMADTFFVKPPAGRDAADLVLRTHTSPVQIRTMLERKPPIRIVAIGTVFRRDDDATHTPVFHQIEGLCVDHEVSMADLRLTLYRFVGAFFGRDLQVRLRPSFFPFVEPGAEFDMQCPFCSGQGCSTCKKSGWIELGGSGMVHPNVFTACGLDPEAWTGWAFGFGIDRMAMLDHGIDDLRLMFEGDVRFLEQFPVLISRAWLGELLAGSDVDLAALDDRALATALTDLGLEVEGMRAVGAGLAAVRIGEVVSVRPHPDADRLRVVELADGEGVRTIVCGASNVPGPSGKVAFVPPGTTLPGGLEIGAKPVRGVASAGMICSETELEIGPDGDGILVLPADFRAGERLADRVPGIVDTIIELGVTPNRPDALGHVGVARDLAVKLGGTFVPRVLAEPQVDEDRTLVEIVAPDRCGRYRGHAFVGARVGPSPLWLRVRLHRLGLRPLSNVVDVTNLVLMEWGQPLHVFDRAKLAEGRVVARRARPREPMRLLDGRDLELSADDLVIADARVPQALAGIMGGEHSGVDATTTDLLLEAAWFHPTFVRRSAKAHGLATDSSHRFERGVDHGAGLVGASARAAALLVELAGAKCVGQRRAEGERPLVPTIRFRPARSRQLLGLDVPEPEARRIFTGLGIEVDAAASMPDLWTCRPPTHRPDLEIEVDLVDELVRHHGLDKLPMTPSLPSGPGAPPDRALVAGRQTEVRLMDAMREHGLHETISFIFTRPEIVELVGDVPVGSAVALANPMRAEASLLRTHMLPGLLDALAINHARHAREVALFERGRVYRFAAKDVADGPTAAADRKLPVEHTRIAVLRSPGARPEPDALARSDARALGAVLVDALARVGHDARVLPARAPVSWLHPGAQAEIAIGDDVVGRFGRVHPALSDRWDLPVALAPVYGELWLERVPGPRVSSFAALPRFPSTARDVSLDLAATVPAATVVDAIRRAHGEIASHADDPPRLATGDRATSPIELLEDWRGAGVPAGRRALLLRLHYRARERSVTDTEVQSLHVAVIERALSHLRQLDPLLALR